MRKIKISPEYGVLPIWKQDSDGMFEDIDIDDIELSFSEELKTKITEWDDLFQKTLNQDYPPDSDFGSETERQNFDQLGKIIFEEITEHLNGKFEVIYKSII